MTRLETSRDDPQKKKKKKRHSVPIETIAARSFILRAIAVYLLVRGGRRRIDQCVLQI